MSVGRPSLAEFGLIAPVHAHHDRDAVAGFTLHTHFPLVAHPGSSDGAEQLARDGALMHPFEIGGAAPVGATGAQGRRCFERNP